MFFPTFFVCFLVKGCCIWLKVKYCINSVLISVVRLLFTITFYLYINQSKTEIKLLGWKEKRNWKKKRKVIFAANQLGYYQNKSHWICAMYYSHSTWPPNETFNRTENCFVSHLNFLDFWIDALFDEQNGLLHVWYR